jgi:hypothetical protein
LAKDHIVGSVVSQVTDGTGYGTIGLRVTCELTLTEELAARDDVWMRISLRSISGSDRRWPPVILGANGDRAERTCTLSRGDRHIKVGSNFILDPTRIQGDSLVPEVSVLAGESKVVWDEPGDSLSIPNVYGILMPIRLRQRVTYRGLVPGREAHLELRILMLDMMGGLSGELGVDGEFHASAEDVQPFKSRMDFTPDFSTGSLEVDAPCDGSIPPGFRLVGHVRIEQDGKVMESAPPVTERGQGSKMVGFLVTPDQEAYIRHSGPSNSGSAHLRNLVRREIEGRTSNALVFRGPRPRADCKPLTLLMPADLKNALKARAIVLGTTQNELVRALIDSDMHDPGEVPWRD